MNPAQFRQLKELIVLYGSAEFWCGANNENDAIYIRLKAHAEQYYKDIVSFLEDL